MNKSYLYRGISVLEDERNAGLIKPKGCRFSTEGQLGEPWMQAGEGVEAGSSCNNAVIAHQYDSDSSNTAFISTTKSYDTAVKFATSGNMADGYVYTLDRSLFLKFGVIEIEREIGSFNNEEEVCIAILSEEAIPKQVIVNKQLIKVI